MSRRLLAACLLLLAASPADARPAHKQALAQFFGPALPKHLNACTTCHLPEPPGAKAEDGDRPHNPFGARLRDVRAELRRAGRPTTLDARLDAVLDEDSDGDGVSNLVELLTGHHPGDAGDRPTEAEVVAARPVLAAFLRARAGYPWRPFEPVRRPAVPAVTAGGWVRTPVDAFLAAEHAALGLAPRPEAPRPVLLRRLYLDLIGLPPTPAELHAFLADDSPDAYEKVVDRLLASPHHGERWGRHWMDVWRYSDWAGFGPQVRDSQPHVWRWRDWIVGSLNRDKPYDRMVLEMLAGDELAPEDPDALAATGYLVRNYKLLSREKWLQDTVEHTFQAFQGITLQCARCHDHMYDPVLQKDYYQVRAVFEPHHVRTDRVPGEPDTKKDGLVRAYDKDLAAPTYLFVRGDDRNPDKSQALLPGVPEALGGAFPKVEPVALPPGAVRPDTRDFVLRDLVRDGEQKEAKAAADRTAARGKVVALAAALVAGDASRLAAGAAGRALMDGWLDADLEYRLAQARHRSFLLTARAEHAQGHCTAKDFARAAWRAQRELALAEAERKLRLGHRALAQAKDAAKRAAAQKEVGAAEAERAKARADLDREGTNTNYARPVVVSYPERSTGRRLALARWLTDRANPLTARVAVNHVWARHFGQGIVPTVADLGRNGRPPSHPALLDWLAAEFMERGWSLKHLHRLIVTSSAYRMASTSDEASARLDRDNKSLWRYPARRLEAEAVRDALFHVAGKLDRTVGGPDIDYPLGLSVPRRSLYFRHAAEKQMEFLVLFDAPSVTECYERKHSVVPQQALALLNSELAVRHGRLLARALAPAAGPDPRVFTTAAFEHVLSRPPTPAELAECTAFLAEQADRLRAAPTPPARRGRKPAIGRPGPAGPREPGPRPPEPPRVRDHPLRGATATMSSALRYPWFTFEDFCVLVREDQKADLLDGVIYMASPESLWANELFLWLSFVVYDFVEAKQLGKIYGSRVAFRLDDSNSPEPDIAFVATDRLHLAEKNCFKGPPDLAIEIVSPESVERDYQKKRAKYEEAGVREYWIIDPLKTKITLLQLSRKGKFREVRPRQGKYLSAVLPGFFLRPEWCWDEPRPDRKQLLAEMLKDEPT